jgi:deferrochelatase/peroxidase EfeB
MNNNSTASTPPPLDRGNIQGLILRGYTHPCSCHMMFNFTNQGQSASPDQLKSFFNTLYPYVQSAEDWGEQKPKMMLNIGLTFNGIEALNVMSATSLNSFPSEFQSGPWSGGSQSSLGDTGKGAPANWWFGNFQNGDLHCVVHAYALTPPDLAEIISIVTGAAENNGISELFGLQGDQQRLTQFFLPDDEIHFGYRDGISEPPLTWPGNPAAPNQGDLNNFLIGYPTNSIIQPGPTTGDAGTFAKDGCYNAFRILYQDVAAFDSLLEQEGEALAERIGRTPLETQEWVAAKLMGRWRNGSPLMLSPDKPEHSTRNGEDFGYVEQDDPSKYKDILSGYKCPFSSHTRVANPRDEDLLSKEGTSGPPRILRRGMPYGPTLKSKTDDGVDRGLIGLFLCGSPSRQFEKIYSWINQNDFSSVFNQKPPTQGGSVSLAVSLYSQDAVLGNRANPNAQYCFKIPDPTGDIQIPVTEGSNPCGVLAEFIVTRGTAYCLLPSLASLRLIAGRS